MKQIIFTILFSCTIINLSVWAQENNSKTEIGLTSSTPSWLIARNDRSKSEEINAYDPFADYSEFENTAEEQENINFFQTGRFLTLGTTGGIQLFTMNMALLYQLGPVYGGYLNYFFDLNFALQFTITGNTHNVTLKTQSGQPFIGSADFFSMGIDFKYFLDKNLFSKSFSWLQPYFFLGIFYADMILRATFTDQSGYSDDSGYGLNMGLGLEFQFLKKIHFGLQYAFKFVTMDQEAIPLLLNTQDQVKNINFRPYGDWMTITLILGVNF